MKSILLYSHILFYFLAGINHFWHPKAYDGLMPPYLKNYEIQLNFLAGLAEIILAFGLVFSTTRHLSGVGILLLLLAFVPIHIYMIQKGNFVLSGFKITPLISWVRLLIFHPILMYWVYVIAIKKQG